MIVLAGGTGALVPSDETDIINHLTECDRLRRRSAKIEEIRAKMRELEKCKSEEEQNTCDTDSVSKKVEKPIKKWRRFIPNARQIEHVVGDGVKGGGNGCIAATGVFVMKNEKGVNKKRGMNNIYDYESGGTFGMKEMNRKGKQVWKKDKTMVDDVAKVNTAGKVLLAVAVAVDAHTIYTAAREDYEGGTRHNTVHTAASIAGSWTGSIQGASYGAAMGSAVAPAIGSLIGGVIGGIVGCVTCEYASSKLAETLYPAPQDVTEEEKKMIGQCAICHEKLDGFDAFQDHFVKIHRKKLRTLYAAVVKRAGVERADIEDPWFFCKAFVTNPQEIWRWTMIAIRDFNDHILMRLGWDIEKEEVERKMKEKELEEQKKLLEEEEKKLSEIAKYRHPGPTGVESFILFGKVSSVVSFVSNSYFSSMKDQYIGGLLRI